MLPADCAKNFRLVRELGSGGYGRVYLADQLALERRVAIKVLDAGALVDADQVARFAAEARTTALLSDRHVVTIHAFGADEGIPWIAYDFIDGPSLRQQLTESVLDWRVAAEAVAQVCDALIAAHAAGIVHRDVKPENVLVAGPGNYKVIDFGISSWGGSPVQTASGIILGTPAYISPEQVLGSKATAASDLYATGVMLYELLTGRTPFVEENPALMLRQHLQSKPEPIGSLVAGVPRELDRIVARTLEKLPADRHASALELRDELRAMLDSPNTAPGQRPRTRMQPAPQLSERPAPGSARTAKISRKGPPVVPRSRHPLPPPRARRRVLAAAFATGAVALAAAMAIAWPRKPVPPPSPPSQRLTATPPSPDDWLRTRERRFDALVRSEAEPRRQYEAWTRDFTNYLGKTREAGRLSGLYVKFMADVRAIRRSIAGKLKTAEQAPLRELKFWERVAFFEVVCVATSNSTLIEDRKTPSFTPDQAAAVRDYLELVPVALRRLASTEDPARDVKPVLGHLADLGKRLGLKPIVSGEREFLSVMAHLGGSVAGPVGLLGRACWSRHRELGKAMVNEDLRVGLDGLKGALGSSCAEIVELVTTGRSDEPYIHASDPAPPVKGTSASGN